MRTLLIFVLLVGAAATAWYLLPESEAPERPEDPPRSSPELSEAKRSPETQAVIGEAIARREEMKRQTSPFLPSDEEKELWRELRPVAESQVPDPDGVGPCPPEHLGGHPALVVRRFRDPSTGHLIWVHEDKARTILQPGMFEPDPKTGEQMPTARVVTKQVPTGGKPLEPGSSPAAGNR